LIILKIFYGISTCETYHTAYTTVPLMMNPRGSRHVAGNRN